MLECRLDTVSLRMGFVSSRTEARQLIRHNGIVVYGEKGNIPSYQVKPSDIVAVTDAAMKQLRVQAALELAKQRGIAEWLDVDGEKMQGVLKAVPERSDLPPESGGH